jgi:hypothetical protein
MGGMGGKWAATGRGEAGEAGSAPHDVGDDKARGEHREHVQLHRDPEQPHAGTREEGGDVRHRRDRRGADCEDEDVDSPPAEGRDEGVQPHHLEAVEQLLLALGDDHCHHVPDRRGQAPAGVQRDQVLEGLVGGRIEARREGRDGQLGKYRRDREEGGGWVAKHGAAQRVVARHRDRARRRPLQREGSGPIDGVLGKEVSAKEERGVGEGGVRG